MRLLSEERSEVGAAAVDVAAERGPPADRGGGDHSSATESSACSGGDVEQHCADGVDNDCDELPDCADPDCAGRSCTDADPCTKDDLCAGAVCVGSAYACAPGQCEATSVCDGQGGCSTTLKPSTAPCDDDDPITCNDHCDGAGRCTGDTGSACPCLGVTEPCGSPDTCCPPYRCCHDPAFGENCNNC